MASLEAHVFNTLSSKLLATEPHILLYDPSSREMEEDDETCIAILQGLGPESGTWIESETRRDDTPRDRISWDWIANVEFTARIDSDEYLKSLAINTIIHPDETKFPGLASYTIELTSEQVEDPPLSATDVGTKMDITFNVTIHRRN